MNDKIETTQELRLRNLWFPNDGCEFSKIKQNMHLNQVSKGKQAVGKYKQRPMKMTLDLVTLMPHQDSQSFIPRGFDF